MKKRTVILIIAAALAVTTISLATYALSNPTEDDITVIYKDGAGTVTIDPSKWEIPVGKAVTLLILKPGSDAENVKDSDIVWIDEQKVTIANVMNFNFKLRSPASGRYIVKVGGFEADPVTGYFNIS